MKLFSEHLGRASNQHELDAIVSRHADLDPAYVRVAVSTDIEYARNLLEALWQKYEPYADRDFAKKLRVEFSPRCWELIVTAVCIERGLSVVPKSDNRGPDVHIEHGGQDVWLEAVVATAGQGPDAVPPLEFGVVDDLPEGEMLLRLRNSLDEKFRKYERYVQKGIVKPSDPFVIAVSRGPIEQPEGDPPLIIKCLFAIGHLQIPITRDGAAAGDSRWSRRAAIAKQSGANVSMTFFEDPAHAGVSAVIYCRNNILNHPEPHGSDFVLVHNPHATNPLPTNFLGVGEEWIPEDDQLRKYDRDQS